VSEGGAGDLQALQLGGARAAASILGVDVVGEFAKVEGPNVFAAARRRGFTGSRFNGHGLYASASMSFGGLGLVAEAKDYQALIFENEAGKPLNVPPAVLRNHTFNLLNRHPHQIDPADERGFQIEVTWLTKRWTGQPTTLTANWGLTRNHGPAELGNHFDDLYLEVQQEIGPRISLTGALSYQRSFVTNETPDPFRVLWTPIADLRVRLTDTQSAHLQVEHQHDESDAFGAFDVEFVALEWSRSPGLNVGLLLEHTNKSDLQLARLVESGRSFLAGTIDYTLFDQHELRLFYGKRNAGFICVGGVCRLEPDFDGVELSLISRF
jgi:hypothetical protein